jgi:hypothetical protein
MGLSTFRFFKGIVSARVVSIVNTLNELNNPQPRYPRIPMDQISYPEEYEDIHQRRTFRLGWRACERGMAIHENLYSNQENLIYSLHQIWERGWLECYHHHPSRVINEQS